ncbi:hypothetical protein [Macrococcus brunensis]|uniref:hypothetical protein n=1 Tax=Macrococcus brunensis TaxID=198483 RepID=UPI001EF08AD8|nr:hypothetical protein [Macrococcus brunensis]ULG71906.1 hypothetical protein MGG12_11635 [Macrococcus brunensis]
MALQTFLFNLIICFSVFSLSYIILNWLTNRLTNRSEPLRIKNALGGAAVFAVIYSVGIYLLSM